jgi:mRNA interferase MazF
LLVARRPILFATLGTSDVDSLPPGDSFPLRVRIQKAGKLKHGTDLLIDQVRAISNARFMFRYCAVGINI